jgi:hypothetical protein
MTSTTYRLLKHPHAAANLVKMTPCNKDGIVERTDSIYPVDPKVDLGGSNLYTSGPDFLKLLTSLLCNDGKLLCSETVNVMLDYRLPETEEFNNFRTDPELVEEHFDDMMLEGMKVDQEGMKVDQCLAGLVNMQDLKGGRKAGSITWSGATRCFWVKVGHFLLQSLNEIYC